MASDIVQFICLVGELLMFIMTFICLLQRTTMEDH